MKWRITLCTLFLSALLPAIGLRAQTTGQAQPVYRSLSYPKVFQNQHVLPSAPIDFILSEEGRRVLRLGKHPLSKTLLQWMGEDTTGVPNFQPPSKTLTTTLNPGTPVAGCSTTTANVFNLEPIGGDPNTGVAFPSPQNEESVDFFYNGIAAGSDLVVEGANDFRGFFGGLGSSVSGYYVRTTTGQCTPTFEGGEAPVIDPFGDTLFGLGDPVVAVDPARSAAFYADIGLGFFDNAIRVHRTTLSTLTNSGICPPGTHDSVTASGCWPTSITENAVSGFVAFNDKPHMRVDERVSNASGFATGAGNVYVSDTVFSFVGAQIELAACNNALSTCSSPIVISGPDVSTQFSHIGVRTDGGITVTYVNIAISPISGHETFTLRYVGCTPNGVLAPICTAPSTIVSDATALPFGGVMATEGFRIATYPKHDTLINTATGHFNTYVVWDRCHVSAPFFGFFCPDSDVLGIAADTGTFGGAPTAAPTWTPAFAIANSTGSHEFMPWLRTDVSRNILNITYYTTAGEFPKHRVVYKLQQIVGCASLPCPLGSLESATTVLDEPQGDGLFFGFGPGFGDYHGVAARGNGVAGASRAYMALTGNSRTGTYNGDPAPQEDNYLTALSY